MKYCHLFLFVALLSTQHTGLAQGTLTVTFDGAWSSGGSEYTSYELSGVAISGGGYPNFISFNNSSDGNGYLAGWYNGGNDAFFDLPIYSVDGSVKSYSLFGVSSIDLGANRFGFSDFSVQLFGYRPDGSVLREDLSGMGTDFRTYMFASEWSFGLNMFEIRGLNNGTWAVDNLVMLVPEPSVGAISALGALLGCCHWLKKRKEVS